MLRPHFSLRTLLLAMLTLSAGAALWRNYNPWRLEREYFGASDESHELSLSPDGKWIFAGFTPASDSSGPEFYKCILWNVASGESKELINDIWDANSSRRDWSRIFQFSNDSKLLIAGISDGIHTSLKFWDMEAQAERSIPTLNAKDVYWLSLSSNGNYLLCGFKDNSKQLIDLRTNTIVLREPSTVTLLAPSSEHLVILNSDLIRVIEIATMREIQRITSVDWQFNAVTYFSNQVLFVDATRTEHFASDPEDGETLRFEFNNSQSPKVYNGSLLSVSPDESYAILYDSWGNRIVDFKTGKEAHLVGYYSDRYLNRYFEWFDNNTRIFDRRTLGVSDVATGRLLSLPRMDGSTYELSPNRKYLLRKDRFNILEIRNYEDQEILQAIPRETIPYHNNGTFTTDSRSFISQNIDTHSIKLWTRYRPERWWGLPWLPEFWLLIILGTAFVWSFRHDRNSTLE